MKIKDLKIERIEKKEVEVEGKEGTIDTTVLTLQKEDVTVRITLKETSTEIAEEFVIGEKIDLSGEIAQKKLPQ